MLGVIAVYGLLNSKYNIFGHFCHQKRILFKEILLYVLHLSNFLQEMTHCPAGCITLYTQLCTMGFKAKGQLKNGPIKIVHNYTLNQFS